MSFVCGILLILYSAGTVSCFPANDIVGEPRTKSHSYITLEAIYKTTATFLERLQIANDTKQSPSLKGFYFLWFRWVNYLFCFAHETKRFTFVLIVSFSLRFHHLKETRPIWYKSIFFIIITILVFSLDF